MRVISGMARGTKLNSIDNLATRPTLDRVKEPLFSIIQNYIEDAKVLDLGTGTGIISILLCGKTGTGKSTFINKIMGVW